MSIDVDYLVVGGGATAMAFVDVLFHETDATMAIVDHRHVPGGHWNDAYPFVRLHQPSRFYGVPSKTLGNMRKETSGLNAGLYHLASGVEIASYYHELMEEVFIPFGRVHFYPLSTYSEDGKVVESLSERRHDINIRERLVDATYLTTNIPLTHQRNFDVADGIVCVPPNELPRRAGMHKHIQIIGGGKTAIDSITWLITQGATEDRLSWVMPRDSWFLNRATLQPGYENFDNVFGRMAVQHEICATAQSVEELCRRMEQHNIWLRIDPDIWPTMFHAATISEVELQTIREVADLVRLGHVKRINHDVVSYTEGEVKARPDTLYIDCTASAVDQNVNYREPVFGAEKIALQMIRPFQPCFSAALIAHLEVAMDNDEQRADLTRPTPMTDTVADWLDIYADGLMNSGEWARNEEVFKWMRGCRLNAFNDIVAGVSSDDTEKHAVFKKLGELGPPAVKNLKRLAATARG
ncbi:MAG: NAD(P)/FAD-dependent oxidoreductase [Pseudomonadota bacterium]